MPLEGKVPVPQLKAEAQRVGCSIKGLTKEDELLNALREYKCQQQHAAMAADAGIAVAAAAEAMDAA
eukprot:1574938-Prymnesium_polylepis.1